MAYASEIEEQMGTSDEAFASHSLIAAAEKIRAPVLAVFGEKDMKADPERADDFVRKVTTQGGWAKAYVLPGYSDIIPIDARNEKLMPFLNRVLYRPE
jgi:dipeptidyl aminopeptidase/acylaminoacyl peptidase